MPDVIVVGAGLAGMAAAHRLLERGYNVTIIEQNAFLGGKLGAHQDAAGGAWHEHAYHMYLNWYRNFWTFMQDVGSIDRFVPMPHVFYLRPGQFGRSRFVTNVGSPWSYWQNILCGVASPADMVLSGISLADLTGQPASRNDRFEQTSVDGFLRSRFYSTPGSVEDASRTLVEAFASPGYLSSARSFKSLVQYGTRVPAPMMWLLTADTARGIFQPWEARLRGIARRKTAGALNIRTLTRVDGLTIADGRIAALTLSRLDSSPTIDMDISPNSTRLPDLPVMGELILAVPPNVLGRLLNAEVNRAAPNLANVRRLQTQPMIALDVAFNRRLPDLPEGITILLESRYRLSFLDTSRLWSGGDGRTRLNVIASDCDTIAGYESRAVIEREFLAELSRFIRFDPKRDVAETHLQTNIGEELFVNQVGSWEFRPQTTCGIPNLFLAGDFCQTFVDVVTVEGAVVSGLMAAEAIRRRHRLGEPIQIYQPDAYPSLAMAAFAAAQMPLAAAAKAVSTADTMFGSAFRLVFPNG